MRSLLLAVLLSCGAAPVEPGGTGGGKQAAGGGAPGIDQEALSGTRLKNRYLKGDDGSRSPLGFYDSVRGEACYFLTAEDGKPRCMPSTENVALISGYYADSGCTEQLAVTYNNCSGVGVKYAYATTETCPARFIFYGATPLSGVAYQKAGTCQAFSPPAGFAFYKVNMKLSPDWFVPATIQND